MALKRCLLVMMVMSVFLWTAWSGTLPRSVRSISSHGRTLVKRHYPRSQEAKPPKYRKPKQTSTTPPSTTPSTSPPTTNSPATTPPITCPPTTSPPTTSPPTTNPPTTSPPTTTDPGVCFYEGKYYEDGEYIEEHPCYFIICLSGGVAIGDIFCETPDGCNLNMPPNDCCPLCQNASTTSSTVTPTTTSPEHSTTGRLYTVTMFILFMLPVFISSFRAFDFAKKLFS